ncbi:FMN-binding protein [Streptomyces sp. JJ36]|uniref:FMN-binding protein n=1 Tax=Streptomyces sp. JJ36 TaxID=2736645 RepID=UPI001EFFB08B|nr:FMN-binding protein [Streptomyces sp. JJ36]MCF6525496.1 FMN-binding protein [Streptomyces sp. JJ36]
MKRKHPLRRVALTGAATVSGVVLLLALKPETDPAAGRATAPAPGGVPGPETAAPGSGVRAVTGDVVRTRFGPVQVRVSLSGDRIVAAAAVRSPDAAPKSRQLSAGAVPRLNREALAAQSARIDAVSGATYTSEGYRRSLQSALDQAGA